MLQSEHTYCAAFHGVVRLSEFCIGSRGIIKDVCKVWGKSGCCRVNVCCKLCLPEHGCSLWCRMSL